MPERFDTGKSLEQFRREEAARERISVDAAAFRRIMETDHGYQLIEPLPPQFSDASYEGLPINRPSIRVLLDFLTEACKQQLTTPIVRDSFDNDHVARRAFQHEMETKYTAGVANEFFQNNKLKKAYGVNIMSMLQQADEFLSQDEIKTPEVLALHALVEQLPTEEVETTEEREQRAEKMDDIARAYLQIVKVLPAQTPGADAHE